MSQSEPNASETQSNPSHHFGPHSIRGVALDMDGLLFDTEGLYWEVGDQVLQRRGHLFSKTLQQRMMGRVGVAALQQMVDFHDLQESAETLLEESDELYAGMLEKGVPPMEGVNEWIALLKSRQIPFGLATSSRRKYVDVLFETIPWRDDLAFTLTGDDVTRGKPDPQMYLLAAERLGIEAAQMMVLEDSGNGCSAAVAAGAYTVAIPSVHTREQNFEGAMLIADSISDPRLRALVDPSE